MKAFFVFLLLMGCNATDFSNSEPLSSDQYLSEEDALSRQGVIAEGMDYEGNPIVLKDPPYDENGRCIDEQMCPEEYASAGTAWQANVVKTVETTEKRGIHGTLLQTDIAIERLTQNKQVPNIKQVSRTSYAFQHRQRGQVSKGSESESFTQAHRGILDILLAIDNSGSMYSEIAQVRSNLSNLLAHISDSNWQIAMVKAEPYGTCQVEGKITSNTANYAQAYIDMLSFSLEGGTEHMLKKARWALAGKSGTNCSGSWLRSNSTVAVIIVSDEKHQCPDSNFCSPTAYSNFVNSFAHTVKTYGFTVWNSTNRAIFAEHGSITGDYAPILKKISANIQATLKDIFTLKKTPDGKTITVQVSNTTVPACNNPKQATGCYEIITTTNDSGTSSAVQFFNYTPPQAAAITVDYSYGAVDFDTVFTLQHDPLPAANDMQVTVTKADSSKQILVRDTDYTLSGTTLSLVSKDVLPEGATLDVNYLENIPLKTSFSLVDEGHGSYTIASDALVAESTRVVISDGNGNKIQEISSGFDFDGETLTFTDTSQVPTAGVNGKTKPQQFYIIYEYYPNAEKLLLQYAFTKHKDHHPNTSLTCHNQTQNNAVDCTHDASTKQLTFTDSSQLAEGDAVIVTEKLLKQGNQIDLRGKNHIADEPIKLKLNNHECDVPPSFIVDDVLVLETLDVADCRLLLLDLNPDVLQEVGYVYKTYEPNPEDFLQMDKDFFSKHRGKYKFEYWEVMINNKRTNKFTLEDARVILDEDVQLGKNATVKITVKLYRAL